MLLRTLRRIAFGACVLAVPSCTPTAAAEPPIGSSVHFLLGQKHLSEDRFLIPETGESLGALLSFGKADWPILIAVDLLETSAEGQGRFTPKVELDTFEVAIGVRRFWKVGQARPYVGGGVVYVQATYEETRDDAISPAYWKDETDGYGPWVSGGVAWRLGRRFDLGFDVRWELVGADVRYRNFSTLENVDFGGFSYGLTFGFEW